MTPESINAVFTGLLLLIGALTTYTASRSRKIGLDRGAFRRLERRYLAALGYVFILKRILVDNGLTVPAEPAELSDGEDDDDPLPARRPGAG